MLAFDDAGLAILIRAAQGVSHRKRHRWLQDTARRLDPSPKNLRHRRSRARIKEGRKIYRLDLPAVDIEAMLQREGLLSAIDPTHAQVEAALTMFLARLAELSANS